MRYFHINFIMWEDILGFVFKLQSYYKYISNSYCNSLFAFKLLYDGKKQRI